MSLEEPSTVELQEMAEEGGKSSLKPATFPKSSEQPQVEKQVAPRKKKRYAKPKPDPLKTWPLFLPFQDERERTIDAI